MKISYVISSNQFPADAIEMTLLSSRSTSEGSCECEQHTVAFSEWLSSNAQAGSTIATDLYQAMDSSESPPSNWNFPPKYLPSDYDAYMIKQVYRGEPLSSASSGWQPLTTLEGTSLITTTNKFLRIKNNGGPVTLRAISNSPKAYGIVAFLVKENPDPTDLQDNGPINRMDLYTDKVADVTEATAMTFGPIPEGYYYSFYILNNFEEDQMISDLDVPPYECTMGPNGLSTKFDVQYSLQTCKEAACNAGTIVVTDPTPGPTPTTSSAKAIIGSVALKAAPSIIFLTMVFSLFQ